MYIGGFLKSLFTPRKLPSALFFLANQFLVFWVFVWLGEVFGAQNPTGVGWVGLVLNLVAMLAMLSPFGEAVVRFRENAKPLSEKYSYARQIFHIAVERARKVNPRLPKDIQLYQMQNPTLNAAATGHHTVIATTALLDLVESGRMSAGMFAAVISHELGHISHSDTSLTLGIVVSGGLLQLVLCGYVFVMHCFTRFIALFSLVAAMVFNVVFCRSVTFLFDCWNKLGVILNNATSRKDEFAADNFAGQCGYAEELCEFLTGLDPSGTRSSGLSVLAETHPATVDRVAALHKDFA